jgi:A/G-specific adenine glycosylase
VAADCVANQKSIQTLLPYKTRKVKRKTQALWWVWFERADGHVWLVQRPLKGIWAQLYACPQWTDELGWLQALGGQEPALRTTLTHVLTHLDVVLHVAVHVVPNDWQPDASLGSAGQWVSFDRALTVGIPQPVDQLLVWARQRCNKP